MALTSGWSDLQRVDFRGYVSPNQDCFRKQLQVSCIAIREATLVLGQDHQPSPLLEASRVLSFRHEIHHESL